MDNSVFFYITNMADLVSLYTYDSLDSTNEEAKRLILKGIESTYFAVVAQEQTKGKGRDGRQWVSPRGNVFLSIALQPPFLLKSLATYSFVAALAGITTIQERLSAQCNITLKWPNDILVDNKKIAGILLESILVAHANPWLVIGVGINTQSFPSDTLYPATSLYAIGGNLDDNGTVVRQYIEQFDRWCEEKAQKGFEAIRKVWLERAEGLGKKICVRLAKEEKEGIFKGISKEGALILEKDGVMEIVTVGDVFLGEDTCY